MRRGDEGGGHDSGHRQMPHRRRRAGSGSRRSTRSPTRVFAAGADALWVHARKAWLEGLSPEGEPRHPAARLRPRLSAEAANPNRFIGINGGIQTLEEARGHLEHVDGVMLGRAAYHTPGILAGRRRRDFSAGRRQPFDSDGADRDDGRLCRAPYRRRRAARPCHAAHGRPVPRLARCAALPADPVDRCDQAGRWAGCAAGGFRCSRFRAGRDRRGSLTVGLQSRKIMRSPRTSKPDSEPMKFMPSRLWPSMPGAAIMTGMSLRTIPPIANSSVPRGGAAPCRWRWKPE